METPDTQRTIGVLKRIQLLTQEQLKERAQQEIGKPMLGAFEALIRAVDPQARADELQQRVHLMALSYLMRGELARDAKS